MICREREIPRDKETGRQREIKTDRLKDSDRQKEQKKQQETDKQINKYEDRRTEKVDITSKYKQANRQDRSLSRADICTHTYTWRLQQRDSLKATGVCVCVREREYE